MNIKQRRLENGWSQEELARHSGLSTRTIQRIEGGQKAGTESLKCLAAVFESSIDDLKQEQDIIEQKTTVQLEPPQINATERAAIKFAQAIFRKPKKGQPDPLWRIEREAIDYAKRLLSKFKT